VTADRGHAIIPAKGLIHGKSRLAAHLDPQSLYGVNLGNLERTLRAAAEFFGAPRCVLVSPCQLTCATVRRMGFPVLFQERNDGLNAGLEFARACLRAAGARTLTVLPVDLAHVSNAALRAALGTWVVPGRAVIVPDSSMQGTNLLTVPADFPFEFSFGPGSFESHLAQLRRGLKVHLAQPSSLQEDIDTIDQLLLLRGGNWHPPSIDRREPCQWL
jgi:2-phospho-L-lactate guanylyltransferase